MPVVERARTRKVMPFRNNSTDSTTTGSFTCSILSTGASSTLSSSALSTAFPPPERSAPRADASEPAEMAATALPRMKLRREVTIRSFNQEPPVAELCAIAAHRYDRADRSTSARAWYVSTRENALRRDNLQPVVTPEIHVVERQNPLDPVRAHQCDEPRVVNLLARDLILHDD